MGSEMCIRDRGRQEIIFFFSSSDKPASKNKPLYSDIRYLNVFVSYETVYYIITDIFIMSSKKIAASVPFIGQMLL